MSVILDGHSLWSHLPVRPDLPEEEQDCGFRFFSCSSPHLRDSGFKMKPLPPGPAGFDMRPLMESLFSGSAFPATANVDHDAVAPGQPSVTLIEWWLATVEGDDQKIAVAGLFKRNQTLYELSPAPIAKCRSPNILESEDGTALLISGSLNVSRTLGNGYSNTVCEHFMVGFPRWWQSCNLRYPKQTNSNTGCQPCSSNPSRPSFVSKHPDGLKSSSHNDSVFPKSSQLSNGTPTFEEHTCDGNIATNENAAASSEAGKYTHDMELTEKEAVDEEMPTPVYLDVQNTFSLSPILEEYTCDGDIRTNEDAAASNDGNGRYTDPSKEPVGQPRKQIFPHEKCQSATRSYWTRSAVSREKHASTGGWSHTLSPTCSATPGLLAGSPSNERGHDDIAADVSLALTVQCTNNAVSEALYSTPATAPVACLKNQGSWVGNQHTASNKKPVGRPKKPHEEHQSATRSHGTRSPVSQILWSPLTRSKATSLSISTPEALKLKRTRSGRVIVPQLNEGYQEIVYGSGVN